MRARIKLSLLLLTLALGGAIFGRPITVQAGVYNADAEVTYKEYWVPHTQFLGGRAEDADGVPLPGCVDTDLGGGAFYLEPAGSCTKTVTFTLPDNFANALKAELYLDIWRGHEPTYVTKKGVTTLDKKASTSFQINNSATWFETHPIGYDWSRTPYVADAVRATDSSGNAIPNTITPVISLLHTGQNTITFKQIGGAYHIHDIAIRIYFDDQHPLLDPQNNPISAPNGSLVSVWADNGALPAAAGGLLTVDDDQLVLTANVTTAAKYVEFHAYYRGYDEDNNDSDGDQGAQDTDWHNLAHNNWHPGGTEAAPLGGAIDHIGTLATPKPGLYTTYWDISHILSQVNVKFKLRIVDQNYVVREAAGGVSAPFTLSRSKQMLAFDTINFPDAGIYMSGAKPLTITNTKSLNLPASGSLNLTDYNEAYFIGAYWKNPFISVNSHSQFRAFLGGEDDWSLSIRKLASVEDLRNGANTLIYSYATGVGHFVEKPGPLIVLKQTTRAADSQPPVITQRAPALGAADVQLGTNISVTVADVGRGVNINTVKLYINGALETPQISGTPDAYTLVYDPPLDFLPNGTVSVKVEACDYANKCIGTANGTYTFRTLRNQYTLSALTYGRGAVDWTPKKALYKYGDAITLTVTPAANWQLTGWTTQVAGWSDGARRYRLPLHVAANGYARTDKVVETAVNFSTLFTNLGEVAAFDPATLHVIEVDSAGNTLNDNVPFQFDPGAGYDATTNATGTLMLLMQGVTAANAERDYVVYFDKIGTGLVAPTFPDLVVRSDTVDAGQESYQFTTATTTWSYHKYGGGFSSLVDAGGNDWISYNSTPANGGGAFRGIPNLVPPPDGFFHPGNNIGTTAVVNEGPLKETIRTVTTDGKWEMQWEIFPTYARMTVIKKDPAKNYWFLYEGVPGGSLDVDSDAYTLSTGQSATLVNSFNGDLPGPEWVYFSDPTLARSLYLIHHQDDAVVDTFRLDNATAANAKMTIFGFGRGASGNTTYMNAAPNVFTVGLMDETAYGAASSLIDAAYQELWVTLGGVEAQNIANSQPLSPVSFKISGNTVATASLEPTVQFSLTTNLVGQGAIVQDPVYSVFAPGDPVTVTATPAAGWAFTGWTGDQTSEQPILNFTMDSSTTITATFAPIPYPLETYVVGGGSVTKTPDQPTYFYGDVVTLTVDAPANWLFSGWSGDLAGVTSPLSLTIDAAKTVTATFTELFSVTVNAVGPGTVNIEPLKAQYLDGEIVTLTPQGSAANSRFIDWSGDLTGADAPAQITVDANKVITATFLPAYTLNYAVNGGGEVLVMPDQAEYLAGEEVMLSANSAPGWQFTGWSGIASTEPNLTVVMDGDKSLTANFTQIPYALNVTTFGNGAITKTPDQTHYFYGDVVTLTALPAADWFFISWDGAVNGSTNPVTVTINGEQNVQATFAESAFTLTTNRVGGGAVTVEPQQEFYLHGTVVTVTASPESGWLFSHWSGDLSGNVSPSTITMDSNKVITASFAQEGGLTVNVEVNGGGAVMLNPNQPTYLNGDIVTLTPQPATGWVFTGWGGDLAGADDPATLLIDDNKHVIANFSQSPVSLNTSVNGRGNLLVTPRKELYSPGEVVTLQAVPELDSVFAGWSGALSGAENPTTLVMDSNKSVAATFTDIDVPAGITSDNFNRCTLNPHVWQFNNPLHDAAYALDGERVMLSVPGGVEHMMWDTQTAPVLLQEVENSDFELDAKFDSLVSERYQAQGVVVQEDDQTLLRVNFQSDGSTVTLFVGKITPADGTRTVAQVELPFMQPPYYLHVKRSNDRWRVSYSSDGANWTTDAKLENFKFPMGVSHVGLFAGNTIGKNGNPAKIPAHTMVVDYFFNANAPIGPVEDPLPNYLPIGIIGQGTVSKSASCGSPTTLTAEASRGWRFVSWSGALNSVENPAEIAFNAGDVVTATFTSASYQVQVTTEGQGAVTIDPQKSAYDYGEEITLQAVAAPGWRFDSWSGDASSNEAVLSTTVRKNLTIQANFFPAAYQVQINTIGQGAVTIDPQKATYDFGDVITLQAQAAPGWHFGGWGGDVTGSDASVQATVGKDLTIQANFIADVGVITATIGQGAITLSPPQNGQYLLGEMISVTAQPAANWVFLEWSGDLSGSANPQSLTLSGNDAVTATFGVLAGGLVISSENGQVSIEPVKPNYQIGDIVTLTATPNPGWEFDGWEIGGGANAATIDPGANPLSGVVIDGETTYKPKFRSDSGAGNNLLFLPLINRP